MTGGYPSTDPFLICRGVSNTYVTRPWGAFGKKSVKRVLDHVDIEIERGEIFGLVGESGCGKTTLGKCILGLIKYEGEIIINGRKRGARQTGIFGIGGGIRERRKAALEVQAVFQDSGSSLNPVKPAGWILEEPLRAHGLYSAAERQNRVDNMMDMVGLDSSLKKRKPHELSSGQKQRVAIGAALMLNPGLLVADEPVSALDASVAAQILNLFRDLNKRLGLALLFISHNMNQVDYLCGRVAVMRNGRIADIRRQPD